MTPARGTSTLSLLAALALATATPAVRAQQPAPPAGGDVLRTWPEGTERTWLGPGLWANRFADWHIEDGRVECVGTQLPLRTAHLLTRRILDRRGTMRARLRLRSIGDAPHFAGLWIGAGSTDLDPRAAALMQSTLGQDGGFLVGIDADGTPIVRTAADEPTLRAPRAVLPRDGWRIVSADSEEADGPAANVLDGDPATIWHTQWKTARPSHPHQLVIDLGRPTRIGGALLLPRQNETAGRTSSCSLAFAETLGDWTTALADQPLPDGPTPQTLHLTEPVTARYVRFVAHRAHQARPSTTLAEFHLLGPDALQADMPDLAWAGDVAEIEVTVTPDADGTSSVGVARIDPTTGRKLVGITRGGIPDRELAGNLALCADLARPAVDGRVRFESLTVDGSRVGLDDRAAYGPFAGCQYTLSRGTLKLTAQLMPVGDGELGQVELQLRDADGSWATVDRAEVVTPSYTAHLRVEPWPHAGRAVAYRVRTPLRDAHGATQLPTYEGTIRAEPGPDEVVTLAAFSCNQNVRHGFGRPGYPWNRQALWFPHDDVLPRARHHDPDLLFFAGDQIYEGDSPTPPVRAPERAAELDYLYKWTLFLWAWGDLTRDHPTITIPDDHDVWQGNLWGGGGRHTTRDSAGGYTMPAAFVRLCERTQTSHLPDPFDATPVEQGIGVYYTSLEWGGVDFAILEDRKFKSGPFGLVPPSGSNRPDHVTDPDFDPTTADVPGATLLGARQLAFLEDWATDWGHGTRLKAVLSQSPFAGLATHHGGSLAYLVADYDSNGWPQAGRNRALAVLRECYAFLISGDQHLATLTWHGIDDWRDAGWSFVVPSIANFYPRMWNPPGRVGANREPGRPAWTGDHLDGFGNKVTVFAAANPGTGNSGAASILDDGMPGYGIVRFDPEARTITAECWPRSADPASSDARLYDGWPRTIAQTDNDGREPSAWLPTLTVEGLDEPVVEVRSSADGSLVRAWRAPGPEVQVGVFATGRYVVRVGDPDRGLWQSRTLEAKPEPSPDARVVLTFDGED